LLTHRVGRTDPSRCNARLCWCVGSAAFYYKVVSDEGLFRYFSLLIDKVADERLRLYLYHIPALTGVPISLGLVERLLHQFLGIVAGIKDSSGDWANTEKLLRFVPPGFDVFTGYETYLLATLKHKGAGTISAMANIAARTLQELFQTWNEPGAQAHQEAINKVQTAFQSRPLISSLKAILAQARGDADWIHVHPPLMPLSVSEREELFTILEKNLFTWPVIR
jgi:4-hydroxy-tetrahydrodipicolinate synthase